MKPRAGVGGRSSLAKLASIALVAGCGLDASGKDACVTQADCLSGFTCQAQRCVAHAAADGGSDPMTADGGAFADTGSPLDARDSSTGSGDAAPSGDAASQPMPVAEPGLRPPAGVYGAADAFECVSVTGLAPGAFIRYSVRVGGEE